MKDYVIWLDSLNREDTARVGGKNASLGEMIGGLARSGVRVPGGFATLASAYEEFLDANGLRDRIRAAMDGLDVDDTPNLSRVGAEIRCWIRDAALPPGLEEAVGRAYATLGGDAGQACPVAVRSSATAEDLPDASFAGQQETFLNVCGTEQVLLALRKSTRLFTTTGRLRIGYTKALTTQRSPSQRVFSKWCAATKPAAASCSPWTPNRVLTMWC